MKIPNWAKEIDATLIVCDENETIIELNDKASKVYEKDRASLIGSKLLDCHPEAYKPKVKKLISERRPSCYTTETKKGRHFVYHTPWFEEGEYRGFVELVIPIPEDLPNIVRP